MVLSLDALLGNSFVLILIGVLLLMIVVVVILMMSIKKKQEEVITAPSEATGDITKEDLGLNSEKPIFRLDQFLIPNLPDAKDMRTTDVKYPLIPPYTFAHVRWDAKETELVYEIEEPVLTNDEKKNLDILEEGIKEIINLSFISVNNKDIVLLYLEKNIKVLLAELSIQLTMNSYLKIMYYIYRDFVGLNELEPLMNDSFIEDIECNGIKTPVYIVHRKYRNIRTNLVFNDIRKMASFVEKLAQKCGRYVSYAEPLLDGSLPDGSRINATYSIDVTSRGPTITVRKFTKEPWSPIQLMIKGTLSAEVYAFIWMAVEYENSLMVVGGTGSGKCVSGQTPIYLADGKKINIKDFVEEKFKSNKIIKNDDWEYVEDNLEILSMDPETLKIIKTKTDKLWRHKTNEELVHIKTRSGREITVTKEHPFFSMNNGDLVKIRADKITDGEVIAVPRTIHLENPENGKIDYLTYLKDRNDLYLENNSLNFKNAIEILTKKYNINETQLSKKFCYKYTTFRSWKNHNAIPLDIACKLFDEAKLKIHLKDIKIKNETQRIKFPELGPDLFKFIAYILADGHLDKNYVMFFNENLKLRREFLNLGHKLFSISGTEQFQKNRTPKAVFNSKFMSILLNTTFNVPIGNKARIIQVPEQLFSLGNECSAKFLSAFFDCESYVGTDEIEFSTTSKKIAPELCTLLLRFSIVPRLITRKDHYRIYITGYNNMKAFLEKVDYTHPQKLEKLEVALSRPLSRLISNVDLVPHVSKLVSSVRNQLNVSQHYAAQNIGISRRLFGMWEQGIRSPSIMTFRKFNSFVQDHDVDETLKLNIMNLAESDIFWDEIVSVRQVENQDHYVYDLTVPKTHNFLAGDYPIVAHNTSFINTVAFFIPPQARIVSIEDTKELQLEHENWLPSVARAGVGLSNLVGQRYGEVSLFDLLRASFRQRPDYIIVGEVRGKEAFVLFQAFASIRGNEEIFVVYEHKPLRIKIKDLEHYDITKLKALSYDLTEQKVKLLDVKAWIKHPKRNSLYKIITKSGREVTVTSDHSLFSSKDNKIFEIKGEDLVIGTPLVIPSHIACGYANFATLNLLEYLPDLRIYAPDYVKMASHTLGYAQTNLLVGCKSITDYYSEGLSSQPNALNAEKFLMLMKNAQIECPLERLEVKFNGMSEKINVFLEISDEFLRLLGYYLSEGSINRSGRNYRIALYNKNEEVLKDMRVCIEKVSHKKPSERITDRGWGSATELAFNHKVLYELIRRYCKFTLQKRIPDFIYGLDKKRIGVFLSALYTGDGHLRDKGISYYTVSKDLANDVAQILLVYGIVASITQRNRKGRKTTDYEINFYAHYKKEEFLKYVHPINKTCNFTEGIVDPKLLGDLCLDAVKSIEVLHLDEAEYVYDIAVPGSQNFIGGFGGILLHNSGHPGMATMHAESVTTLIKRLETEPINLSGSLIETLAAVVVMTQTRVNGKEVRRVSSIDEIIEVKEGEGGEKTNKVIKWDPKTDSFIFNANSKIFDKISLQYGFSKEQVLKEFQFRSKLLKELFKRGIVGFKEVQGVIHEYYKAPNTVLKRYGII